MQYSFGDERVVPHHILTSLGRRAPIVAAGGRRRWRPIAGWASPDAARTSGVRLINYTSDKGDKLQAALFLPANYEKGTAYPTVVNFYERMSQQANTFANPSANGFNRSVYTSNGYAVLVPDIAYKVNDPGMSAVWCMVPAVKAAIATGVVDAK